MTDYTELKRLAEAATPGPWIADSSHHEGSINSADRHIGMVSMYARRPNDIIQNFSNQAFIAAANPEVVLTLIAESYRQNDGAHMRAINSLRQDCRDLMSERDQLKAENEAAQALIGSVVIAAGARLGQDLVEVIEGLHKSAERYQWLRLADWWRSPVCVIRNPKEQAKLGSDCPSGERLDEAVDAAMGNGEQS